MKVHPKTHTPEELQSYLKDRARKSRLVKGYSQTDLSRFSNVSYSSIRKFEQTGEISLTSLLRIADALDETLHFENLFPRAVFYSFVDSGLLKRPKRCNNGTYNSSRIQSPAEIERYLAFEDSPTSFKKSAPKRKWKVLSKPVVDLPWDPIAEMEAIAKDNREARIENKVQ